MARLLIASLVAALSSVAQAGGPKPLAAGEGYVALVFDVLQPTESIRVNEHGGLRDRVIADDLPAGKSLVVAALPSGQHCLQSYVAANAKWTVARDVRCFTVSAGKLVYGGHLMPRLYRTPRGDLVLTLQLSDPFDLKARLETEHPTLRRAFADDLDRLVPDDEQNRAAMTGLGSELVELGAYKQGNEYLKVAVKLGSAHAMRLLAHSYRKPHGLTRDFAKAAALYGQAADAGDARGAAMHCIALDLGKGVAEDPVAALHRCSAAAEAEDAMGMWYLGRMIRRGRGGATVDLARAAELEQRAESTTDFALMMMYGWALTRPDESYPDPEGSFRIASLAEKAKDSEGTYRLANYYLKGIGTPVDAAAAEHYYLLAAARGGDNGYFQVALMYAHGKGVAKDPAKVRKMLDEYATASPRAGANTAAWFMATFDDPAFRDGRRALLIIKDVLREYPDDPPPAYLDTLAAVYAELGKWSDAVKQQRRALALVQRDGLSAETEADYRSRLDEYLAQKPHRERFE